MHAVKPKADRKGKVTGEQSWAQAIKAESLGVSRDDERRCISTKGHRAFVSISQSNQHFAGVPGGFTTGIYPVSAKPKQKPKCARP